MFYQKLIENISKCNCGLTVENNNFNVTCYADDILLFSTTSSGLQKMINVADKYIRNHGLSFNPTKTECMISGHNPLTNEPSWMIDNQSVTVVPSIKYLGTILDNSRGSSHKVARLSAAQRAFYSLQGAGIKYRGVSPTTACKIYTTAIQSVLTYGCSTVFLTKSSLNELNTLQGKNIKTVLGLNHNVRSTPLMEALDIPSVSTRTDIGALNLLKAQSNSVTSLFYTALI